MIRQYGLLRELVKVVKGNEAILDAAKHLVTLYPNDMIEKAEKEIERLIGEAAEILVRKLFENSMKTQKYFF